MAFVYYDLLQENADTLLQENGDAILLDSPVLVPTTTTAAVSAIKSHVATGNGEITGLGGQTADKRGFVWGTVTKTNPGNTAPSATEYDDFVSEDGDFSTGTFTGVIDGLLRNTTYYVRAFAKNGAGYSYGDEVSFTSIQFTNPANIYASDDTYTTLAAISGAVGVELSKDGGATWQNKLSKTFTSTEETLTYGDGQTETWGATWRRSDMVDANFRIRISHDNISQVYKTFGFTTGTDILTGIEVAIEGKYASDTLSLDNLKVKIYYGTSTLSIQAGSMAFASDGRKAGETEGNGTGVLVFYDGSSWIACDTGAVVAA